MPYARMFSNYHNFPGVSDLNRSLPEKTTCWSGSSIQFVEQKGKRQDLGFDSLYEPRIFLKGEVKTRQESWHDFFNAMIWHAFPLVKSYLNKNMFYLFDENAKFPWVGPPKNRNSIQDILTMFDEGGCFLVHVKNSCGDVTCTLPYLYGHGFYERLAYGDKDLSAYTINLNVQENFLELNDLEKLKTIDEVGKNKLQEVFIQKSFSEFYALSYFKMKEFIDKHFFNFPNK